MPEPYLGEIRMFAGTFAPRDWAFCNGQVISISDNDALFTLLGTMYGGDGQNTFALPNLQGRLPLHQGNGLALASAAGTETVTLTAAQTAAHTHPIGASGDGASTKSALGGFPAQAASNAYASEFAPDSLASISVSISGGSQPHDNMQPYLCINFIISLTGEYPNQN